MKVRWTGEPRALADPQLEVAAGDVVEVDDAAALSLLEQGLAEAVDTKPRRRKPKADVSAETPPEPADAADDGTQEDV